MIDFICGIIFVIYKVYIKWSSFFLIKVIILMEGIFYNVLLMLNLCFFILVIVVDGYFFKIV